jgi:hypothetical protein
MLFLGMLKISKKKKNLSKKEVEKSCEGKNEPIF